MSSTLSGFGRNLLMAGLFTPELVLGFTECHFALTVLPLPLGANGLDTGEPSGGGYVRVEYPLGADWWQLSGYGSYSNTADIIWPTATDDWGTMTGWAVLTDQDAGDLVITGTLAEALTVTAGDVVTLPAGGVQVTISD